MTSLNLEFPLFFHLDKVSRGGSGGVQKRKAKRSGPYGHTVDSKSSRRSRSAAAAEGGQAAAAAASSSGSAAAKPNPTGQLCGVLEFSAAEGTVYIPAWIMHESRIEEGERVRVRSIAKPKQGTFCKLRPHDFKFVQVLEEMGPRYLLESCLQGYSVLQAGRPIVIRHKSSNYWLDVVETRPARAVSIVGSADLEVEFEKALNFSDKKASDQGKTTDVLEADLMRRAVALSRQEANLPMERPVGAKVLRDDPGSANRDRGVPGDAKDDAKARSSLKSTWGGASDSKVAPGWRKSRGYSLADSGGNASLKPFKFRNSISGDAPSQPAAVAAPASDTTAEGKVCPTCQRRIPERNFAMHQLRCARMMTKCERCGDVIHKSEAKAHAESHELAECDMCGQRVERRAMERHKAKWCSRRPVVCRWCDEAFEARAVAFHEKKCGDTEQACQDCGMQVARRDAAAHRPVCAPVCECGQAVLLSEIKAHRIVCPCRPVACEFCKLHFPYRDIAKHRGYCGSRTRQCPRCQKWIKLRFQEIHDSSDCALGFTPTHAASVGSDFSFMGGAAPAPAPQLDRKFLESELIRAVQDLSLQEAGINPLDMERSPPDKPFERRAGQKRVKARRRRAVPKRTRAGGAASAAAAVPSRSRPAREPRASARAMEGRRALPAYSRQTVEGLLGRAAGGDAKRRSEKLSARRVARRAALSGSAAYKCPQCGATAADFERLQMHVLTSCKFGMPEEPLREADCRVGSARQRSATNRASRSGARKTAGPSRNLGSREGRRGKRSTGRDKKQRKVERLTRRAPGNPPLPRLPRQQRSQTSGLRSRGISAFESSAGTAGRPLRHSKPGRRRGPKSASRR